MPGKVVSFSFVQKTKKIENLLGSSLVLESSSDYMEAIASCISKLESIKADNKAEINNVKSKIRSLLRTDFHFGAVVLNGFEKTNLKQPTITHIFIPYPIGTLVFSKIII